jgi:hypothetical protein
MLPVLPTPGLRTVTVMEGAKVKFRASDVTVPSLWSDAAASTLFRIWARRLPGCTGVQERWDDKTQSLVSVPGYENSVYEMVNRVVDTIGAEGIRGGYFDEANGAVFSDELRSMFLNQYGLLNTPAWVNIGVTEKPQASACFIVGVGDSLASLRKWQDSETVIFNSGSGSGADLSAIRPEGWPIAGGVHPTPGGPWQARRPLRQQARTRRIVSAWRRYRTRTAKVARRLYQECDLVLVAGDINRPGGFDFVPGWTRLTPPRDLRYLAYRGKPGVDLAASPTRFVNLPGADHDTAIIRLGVTK